MKVHSVFHISLLTPYHVNIILSCIQPLSPPIVVNDAEEYKVEWILNSQIQRQRLKYLVDWTGYSPDERTWETAADVANATETLEDYHHEHPNRLSPRDVEAGLLRRSAAPKRGGTVKNRR